MRPNVTDLQHKEMNEAEEGLLKSDKLEYLLVQREPIIDVRRQDWRQNTWTWIFQGALLTISFTLFMLSRYRPLTDDECLRHMYPYCEDQNMVQQLKLADKLAAPALDVVKYEETLLQGEFMTPSPFRGRPTPEMDALWENLWDWGAFSVPEDKIPHLNKSDGVTPWHQLDDEHGGGYAGMSWGYHQLHCLDKLRQWSYRDEYYQDGYGLPEVFRMDPIERRDHLDHCIEVIRMEMMCSNDVTPYLVVEAAPGQAEEHYRIDFSIWKKCRNWDTIRDWMVENRAMVSKMDHIYHPRTSKTTNYI